MRALETALFLLVGAFLGATPVLSYAFTHGPACPCHAIVSRP